MFRSICLEEIDLSHLKQKPTIRFTIDSYFKNGVFSYSELYSMYGDGMVTIITLSKLIYLILFNEKARLIGQGRTALEVDYYTIWDQLDIPILDYYSCNVPPSQYLRRRMYEAFPELHAGIKLSNFVVDDQVVEIFGLEYLLTIENSRIRETAKKFVEQRQIMI